MGENKFIELDNGKIYNISSIRTIEKAPPIFIKKGAKVPYSNKEWRTIESEEFCIPHERSAINGTRYYDRGHRVYNYIKGMAVQSVRADWREIFVTGNEQ